MSTTAPQGERECPECDGSGEQDNSWTTERCWRCSGTGKANTEPGSPNQSKSDQESGAGEVTVTLTGPQAASVYDEMEGTYPHGEQVRATIKEAEANG